VVKNVGMRLPLLEDLPDVAGKRVLVRCDFNVPLSNGRIVDDLRIRAALPTLEWLKERSAIVTTCTHLGRPKGKPDPRFSVEPVRERLAELLPGVTLLENLRFNPGEEANDPDFVRYLVAGQDLYVNDAFASAHRAHASIVGPPTLLPSAAGRLLADETEILSRVLDSPSRPFVAVLGGAKISDKLGVISSLLKRVDTVLVGGGMCFTFNAAEGLSTGDSPVEEAWIDPCRDLLESGRIVLPTDLVVVKTDDPDQVRDVAKNVPAGWRGMDIGPATADVFAGVVASAGTIFWNGPLGVFEDPRFSQGTRTVAEAIAASPAFSVVGGGETLAAVDKLGLSTSMGHLSTGGGAMLQFVEQGDLPGLRALRESAARRESTEGKES